MTAETPAKLATYIALTGNTAEAMEHWHDVFGGELDIMRYRDMPKMEGMPFEPHPDLVAHAVLKLPSGTIAGGDTMDDNESYTVQGTAYSLLYETPNADEARELMEKLVAGGGKTNMPFEEAPWGGWYGQVFDRFGVMWAFSAG